MQGANSKNRTISKVKSPIMSIVKYKVLHQAILGLLNVIRLRRGISMIVVVEGSHRLGESPFLEVEISTKGSLLLMKRGGLHRPSS